jgi:CRISPR-associated exonuclease Cas4
VACDGSASNPDGARGLGDLDGPDVITLVGLLVVTTGLWLLLRGKSRNARASIGLPQQSRVLAGDDCRLGSPTLRSRRLGLIGRPDHIIRSGQLRIPVEQKPLATRLEPGHVYQIAAQCMLIADQYRVRPPYGIVVLAGGRQQRVAFTPELERRLLRDDA